MAKVDPLVRPIVEGWINILDASGPARDISLLRPDRHGFSGKTSGAVTWRPFYCVLQPTGRRLLCLHSADQVSCILSPVTADGIVSVKIGDTKNSFVSQHKQGDRDRNMRQWRKASLEMFSRRRGLSERKYNRSREGSYEKPLVSGDRRGSVPLVVSCVSSTVDSCESLSSGSSSATPSRLMSFISRKTTQFKDNLKRTRSATKLDNRKPDVVVVGNGSATIDAAVSTPVSDSRVTSLSATSSSSSSLRRVMSLGRLSRRWNNKQRVTDSTTLDVEAAITPRTSSKRRLVTASSHESLLTSMKPSSSSTDAVADAGDLVQRTVELAGCADGAVEIHPLHGSVLGQQHCFQVSTRAGNTYFACRSEDDRREWMDHFRRTALPQNEQQQHCLRTEHQLKLWVLEAKNIPPKYRYFCEVCLDKTLYARTTSRLNVDMLFWGEHFDLFNLPPVEKITINMFREADKRRKKDSHTFVGSIDIATSDVGGRQMTDRWFTLTPPSTTVRKDNRATPGSPAVIRIKVHFRSIKILPVGLYKPLIEFVQSSYAPVLRALEPSLTVRTKDELATLLVTVFHSIEAVRDFLVEIVMDEVANDDNHKTLFRGNSVATKAMEAYMKLVGQKYLSDTLGDYIHMVMESRDNFEVDPNVVGSNGSSAELQRRRERLIDSCRLVWYKIVNSQAQLPLELRQVFMSLRERCRQRDVNADVDVGRQLISSCIFLRFLCPAILSPSLFGLTQTLPQQQVSRNLTLVAKTIQGLANFARFEGKEGYMTFMNSFVEEHIPEMKKFLDQLSTMDACCDPPTFTGHVDHGKEASQLHSLLVDLLDKVDSKKAVDAVEKLRQITSDITVATADASQRSLQQHSGNVESRSCQYDNVTSLSTSSQNVDVSDMEMSAGGRFVSNTSVTLSPATLPPGAPARRTTMRELQDSLGYVSFTSPKDLPVCAPAAAVRQRPQTPAADVEKEWKQIVYAAETVVEGSFHGDEFSDASLEHLPACVDSGDQRLIVSGGGGDAKLNGLPLTHPLAFANPLFLYRTSARGSTEGSTTSLESSHIQKSYSLTSVNGSTDVGSPSAAGCGRPATVADRSGSPGNSVLAQQRVGGGAQRWKPSPSQSNESLTGALGNFAREQQEMQHSAISSAAGPAAKPLGLDSSLSRSTELSVSCDADQSKRSSVISSTMGLDTPPDSPRSVRTCHGNRKTTPSQNNVRMGVRSMQRRVVEPDKSKIEYEMELQTLRQQLSATQSALDDVTSQLSREKSLSCQQHSDWQQRLRAAEDRHREREADLTAELGRTKHHEAELNAELGRVKQREADVTFELTQQRNRVSEMSIELAQAKRREAELNEELRRLTQTLANQQTTAASQSSNAVEHTSSRLRPVYHRLESAPNTQSVAIANTPPRTRLCSEGSLMWPGNPAWTEPL